MTTNILLVDDHKILRDGLRMLIQKEPEMEVIAEAENGLLAIEICNELKPDVVVMDIRMPDMNGIDATRQIKLDLPDTIVVALSMHSDSQFITGIFDAGAQGYLLKDSAFEELVTAIRSTVSGQIYVSPKIAETVVTGFVNRASTNKSNIVIQLTPREREVLALIADGNSTQEIADLLKISAKTINAHRQNLMEKLNIRNVAELTKLAIREGLTSLER